MLLMHVRVLHQLNPIRPDARNAPVVDDSNLHCSNVDNVSLLCSFITSLLVTVPPSSLRDAYMQQCATMLAAALIADSPATGGLEGLAAPAGQQQSLPPPLQLAHQAPSSRPGREPQPAHDQVLALSQHLLQLAMGAATAPGASAPPAPGPAQRVAALDGAAVAERLAAAAQLQHLETLPGTGLLALQAAGAQLQRLLEHLHDAAQLQGNWSIADVLAAPDTGVAAAWRAIERAAAQFQAASWLLDVQERCLCQLGTWCVALAAQHWLPGALSATVSAAVACYGLLPALNQAWGALLGRCSRHCAQLATLLQHTAVKGAAAAGAHAPVLRALCTQQCVRLRDVFDPTAGSAPIASQAANTAAQGAT